MGNVYAATDVESQAIVAIKVVSRTLFDDVLMARLHREAEAAAKIHSDFVPRVLHVSETDEGEVFLVMERLVGQSLSDRLRSGRPVEWKEVAEAGEDILRGLIDAHTAGIVHRDLKPSNVFLAMKQGRIRAMVLDFGVCKIDGIDTERLTGTGESIGTVAYMAPEQIRGASKVDDRADLYAFGALVFEMACGRLPHDGPSQMGILASKLENDPARLQDCACIDVPPGLDELIMQTLAREPEGRPSSAQQLLRAWRGLSGKDLLAANPGLETPVPQDEAPTSNLSLPSSTLVPTPAHTETSMSSGVSFRSGSSGRLAFVLAGVGIVAGFSAVAVFFARSAEAPSAPGRVSDVPPPAEVSPAASPATAITTLAAANDPATFELHDNEATDAGKKIVRPSFPRTVKPHGPRITDKPRY